MIVHLNEIAQQIRDQVTREREDSREKYQALERANHDLQSGNYLFITVCVTFLSAACRIKR